ncbi:MAG: glycine--tRNA ligase subunit beta, partial [Dokdonella sp.]
MSSTKSLLVELGTEELPPRALDELASAFAEGIVEGLRKRGVEGDFEHARTFCSPRRLAVLIGQVANEQPTQTIEKRGPAVSAGRDANGTPAKALSGFAQSCGVEVDALETLETDKGSWFVYRAEKPGQTLAQLIPELVLDALRALPIPKPMRWGDHDYSFVRPVHWLVILHGAEVLDAHVLGIDSGRQSSGHRYHHPHPVQIADADAWLDALRSAHVLADPHERRERIRAEVTRVARTLDSVPRLAAALLDEIAN